MQHTRLHTSTDDVAAAAQMMNDAGDSKEDLKLEDSELCGNLLTDAQAALDADKEVTCVVVAAMEMEMIQDMKVKD